MGTIRLNKFLAQAGVASRREADKLIQDGVVRVNGELVSTLGQKVDPEADRVEVRGQTIDLQEGLSYLVLNKPRGVLVTSVDPFRRPTVMDLLPPMKTRIYPVGRLDLESEGLLLLTNDGELTNRLLHPRYQVKKVYQVKVTGRVDPAVLSRIEKGIVLDGRKTAPARVKKVNESARSSLLRFELHEGRKREIRRMVEAVGPRVLQLKRIQFAGIGLGNLGRGQWRRLSGREIEDLRSRVGLGKTRTRKRKAAERPR